MDRIVRPLGEDSAAATYEAADAAGRRLIYTVGKNAAADPEGYRAWARAVAELSAHPNIVDVTLGGVGADGRPFLVSGTAERTLSELLTASSPPSADVVVHVVAKVADALEAVHARGFRHGAVCPSTILLDGDGAVRLAGFDTRAPEMAAPVVPGAFTAPEGQSGPPSDVYALAATAYVALGGTIPYAAAPIEDLPGVPVEITGMLRAALHPDPGVRPGAGLLRDSLSRSNTPAGVIASMDPSRVGSPVRPVNDTVVSINLAVAGAAATGIAATAGILAGKAAPVLLAQATGQGTAGAAAVQSTAAATTAKGGGLALVWKIGIGVTAAAVVAGAAVVGIQVANDEGIAAPPEVSLSQPPMRGVDFASISFVEPNRSGDTIQLAAGTAEVKHENVYDDYTWTLKGDPAYADLDGDADLDAVLVMEHLAYEYAGVYVMAWLWEDGKAVQAPNAGEGMCAVDGLKVVDGLVQVTGKGLNPHRTGCFYEPAKESAVEETFTVGMRDGYLAQIAPAFGSPDRCNAFEGTQLVDVLEPVTPRLAPKDDAPAVEGEFPSIAYDYGEWLNSDGWTNARLTYPDESVACGWIKLEH
ncbi:hypothetical protein [Phytomonospora endophytica]|uniref:non-specific serine/threonine protein kinase n=1 Tax=Phytomonospora endophytica TaxID=714109 RepID=A0A841FNV9_9ACTN|nr:hypothetical protein [Phytomonospora endophytica]MBB6035242.1 serine/threonine protein kinase [Phytomonospora endophytica]GIG64009.1 hypothetical protein Pen01_03040 [Phytomonospora endophytica]